MILATGCAGKGERIDLKVPMASGADEKVVAMSSATVAIQPFDDSRTDRSHLGTRHHLWGGESHFSLPSGTLGEATAQAFAVFLNGKGWNVSVTKGDGATVADMTITGNLVDVGVDAKSGIGQTTLNAKSRMIVENIAGLRQRCRDFCRETHMRLKRSPSTSQSVAPGSIVTSKSTPAR